MPIKGFAFNNNTPIYLQISKYYQAKVFIGEIEPGDVIPSRRELAGSFGVNLNTVQKAYAYMEEIGLICTEKNKQSTITLDLDLINRLKTEYLKEPLMDFIYSMKSVNIDKKTVLKLVGEYYDLVEEDVKADEEDDEYEDGYR